MQPSAELIVENDERATDQNVLGRDQALELDSTEATAVASCFHCGTPCPTSEYRRDEKNFCCRGCLTVFELLTENGLTDFYSFADAAGVRVPENRETNEFGYLDNPTVREQLVDFANDQMTRVTFRIPAIHCLACVWLLENLFRLEPGLGKSEVNFPRKELAVTFDNSQVKLSGLVRLLAALGYEPDLHLSDMEAKPRQAWLRRRVWLQLGIAGFAFGNIMLLSISSYLGLDQATGPGFKKLFGHLSLLLALPVFFYSAADYWKSAWFSIRQRLLSIDVPIALGIAALFGQSSYEVLSGRGEGYFDSLSGLLFFLLCGRLFQQKTFDRLAFDRGYKSFFPLAATRRRGQTEERVALSQLQVGDRLLIRHGELIPVDARLLSGTAKIDYSFVTGESEMVEKKAGDHLYAGGRQGSDTIEVEMTKPVSQSYLTALWDQPAFRKEKCGRLRTAMDRYSPHFTKLVLLVAGGAALFWGFFDSSRAVKAFISVLIVACPCALALAAPFALGTAQRFLARRNIFLKNPNVLESLARVTAVVFDKTGTLTVARAGEIGFCGPRLTPEEQSWIYSLARHSTHPYAARICGALAGPSLAWPVTAFLEMPGRGLSGLIAGHSICLGSAAWLEAQRVAARISNVGDSVVHVAIDGKHRGYYSLASTLRPRIGTLIEKLARGYQLALLSGDNEKQRDQFEELFGNRDQLHFNQQPLDKLRFIQRLQQRGAVVMMVGDGLNDAGALQQCDVGVSIAEDISSFTPASDVIASADQTPCLDPLLRFAKASVRIVRASFVISSVYNLAGLSIAASGMLSPVICAILMPLSSATVVAFACGTAHWAGRRTFDLMS